MGDPRNTPDALQDIAALTTLDQAPRVRLTEPQMAAIDVFSRGGTLREATEVACVSQRTVGRWRADPAFLAVLDQALDVTCSAAMRKLRANAEDMVDRIVTLSRSAGKDDRTKLDAAALVLAHIFGQPARRSIVTGAGGGPIEHRSVTVHYDAEAPRGQRYQIQPPDVEGTLLEAPTVPTEPPPPPTP